MKIVSKVKTLTNRKLDTVTLLGKYADYIFISFKKEKKREIKIEELPTNLSW